MKVGSRVELFDETCKGTIMQIVHEHFWVIKWDDGQIGNVHPDDVKHLKS